MTGPLALFLEGLAFALVLGSLFVIVHALGRRVERWRRPWTRWVWAALAAEYVVALAALFIVHENDAVLTAFGISYVGAIVVDVAYLLRVVFPPAPRGEEPPGEPVGAGLPAEPSPGSVAMKADDGVEEGW